MGKFGNIATWLPAMTTVALAACAPAVPIQDAQLNVAHSQGDRTVCTVSEDVIVQLPTGYARRIAAGSHWRVAGTLAQGQVFRPIGTVFTIEGRQIHEAWLVVRDRQLVGFFLPGEGHFSPLDKPVLLTFGDSR